jgi:hypothetical protein
LYLILARFEKKTNSLVSKKKWDILVYLSTTGGLPDGIPLNSKNSQNYYDPATDGTADTGLEYAAADLQNTNTSHEYRRKRSAFEQNMVTKMLQLEQIFKKYEVEEDECRAYIACEAANVERLAENGPIVQKTHELFNAINYAKPEHLAKINASKGMMIMKQAYDSAKARQHEVDVCAPLRDACSALRQKKN